MPQDGVGTGRSSAGIGDKCLDAGWGQNVVPMSLCRLATPG